MTLLKVSHNVHLIFIYGAKTFKVIRQLKNNTLTEILNFKYIKKKLNRTFVT